TSKNEVDEVGTSATMVVEDLEETFPTCVEDVESFEDILDIYDQLYEQFLKQQRRVLVLSNSVNTSEEDRKTLHVNFVKSKAHFFSHEEEKNSL
ncbi:unnamed protein product, partial [Ilex paraguariensis]